MNGDTMATSKADPYQDSAYHQPHALKANKPMEHHHLSPEMQACVAQCLDCHQTCLSEAMNHCLEAGGPHVKPHHFRLMMNCAEICQTSANFMLSNSPLHAAVCCVCAQVCEACAQSCDPIKGMTECAQSCRRCAESCRNMAQMSA